MKLVSRALLILGAATILQVTCGCQRSHVVNALPQQGVQHQGSLQLVAFVTKILAASDQPGSLVYESSCAGGQVSDPFQLTTPIQMTPVTEALKEGFARDPRLSARLESGLIRVTGGDAPRDLLNLQIGRISFDGQNDPRAAVGQLLNLPALTDYARAHHIRFLTVLEGIYAPPAKETAHLHPTAQGGTLSQALDEIARTFPGIWIYRECSENGTDRVVYIGFQQFSSRSNSP